MEATSALPWSSYAADTCSAVMTPYGVVKVPISAVSIPASKSCLKQELSMMRIQMEAFFGRDKKNEVWWETTIDSMSFNPKYLLTVADFVRGVPSVGSRRRTPDDMAKAYSSLRFFLMNPSLWPTSNDGVTRGILRKTAVDLVNCASGKKRKASFSPSNVTLQDFAFSIDHLVVLSMPDADDDLRETMILKTTLQVQVALSTPAELSQDDELPPLGDDIDC
eukprot:TRINITY_DN18730_c0_g1_i1.p1 TRINITY_DN18730_c0_g1~~TRINITY_DN18730_c0_g1_i1.p1  ORF type:complete len:238 (+),score=41.02 TRINITY_DN18730_c0_g1_i1:54-716(+)